MVIDEAVGLGKGGGRDKNHEGAGVEVAARWRRLSLRWWGVGRVGRGEVGRIPVRGGEESFDQIDEDLEGDAPLLRGGSGAKRQAAHYVRTQTDDGDTGGGNVRVHVHPSVGLLEVGLAQEDAGCGVLDEERLDGVE